MLPRLVSLVEVAIIEQLTKVDPYVADVDLSNSNQLLKVVEQGGDVCEQAISLLQPCQVIYHHIDSYSYS